MKTYPVYFYGNKVADWNPLIQTLMQVLNISLMEMGMSTSDYGNLIVDFDKDKVIVVTRMSGEGG